MSLSLVIVMVCTGYTTGNMNWYNKSDKLIPDRDDFDDQKETLLATQEVSYYIRDFLVSNKK